MICYYLFYKYEANGKSTHRHNLIRRYISSILEKIPRSNVVVIVVTKIQNIRICFCIKRKMFFFYSITHKFIFQPSKIPVYIYYYLLYLFLFFFYYFLSLIFRIYFDEIYEISCAIFVTDLFNR